MVEYEKFYVIATHWEATVSTVFRGKILRQTTRTSARNYTVSKTGEILMYVLHYVNCTCRVSHAEIYTLRMKYVCLDVILLKV